MNDKVNPICHWAVATALMAVVGCGNGLDTDYSSLGLVPISGQVTIDGQPLAGAVVFFEAADLTQAYATTDDTGHYQLKFNSEVHGVTVGPKIVRISTTASTGEVGNELAEDDDDEAPTRRRRPTKKVVDPNERVPAVYNEDSLLKVQVAEQDSTINFRLTSDGKPVSPEKA
ncbi:hypothetical protein K227x_07260 [Rubripirellula lacrimiformis]|uniref:Carboxypeptidase regulatory-like domain-containing protein n=1 Tax=Rubripirellula lacrimiformis TaxID=1930273 RepID=A0A517N5E1_9BACT|nr:carboxypeptidase-like regulatory domain-containing protein [Rubripirellula lacrimiformis]QDT02350.1 hypothetical protein K227x_07260 [Rubripirellula lacrimiformis]